MSERLDAICAVPGRNGKSYWTRVGTAFRSKKGEGYTLFLDFIPVHKNEDGKLVIALSVPRERGDAPPARPQQQTRNQDLDDSMPF